MPGTVLGKGISRWLTLSPRNSQAGRRDKYINKLLLGNMVNDQLEEPLWLVWEVEGGGKAQKRALGLTLHFQESSLKQIIVELSLEGIRIASSGYRELYRQRMISRGLKVIPYYYLQGREEQKIELVRGEWSGQLGFYFISLVFTS